MNARHLGVALGIATIITVGFLATTGQYVPGSNNAAAFNPRTQVTLYSDGLNPSGTSGVVIGDFAGFFSGAGAVITQLAAETAHPGLFSCSTGTTTTGRCAYLVGAANFSPLQFGGGQWSAEIVMRPGADLCDAVTEVCIIRCGFIDSVTGESVDGAFFRFAPAESANWRIMTISNSVSTGTNIDSSPAVGVAASTYYRLGIVVAPDASSVEFSINGASAGTLSSNIPTGAARSTAFGCMSLKSAGTTARLWDFDYAYVTNALTAAR
jgi:hypothetical protein